MSRVLVVLGLGLLLGLGACGDDAQSPPVDEPTPEPEMVDVEPEPEPEPEVDPSEAFVEALYDPLQVVEVRVEMPQADWDLLRHEARSIDSIIGPGCDQNPSPSVTTYRSATVTINGVTTEEVGVKSKGFLGSINPLRPSLKVKLDAFVDQDLHGVKNLTFNNNNQDPSGMHTCLSFHLFNKAGIAAPRCNLARITVNGQDMGLFSHAEPIKKPFLERSFGDSSGALFEGALSDFIPGRAVTFERKTPVATTDLAEIDAVIEALEADDDDLIEALEAVLDLDQFLRFWAMEVITSHWDGYAGNNNNFYVYKDPVRDRLVFIPHGTDSTFQTGGSPRVARVIFARSALPVRLLNHPEGKRRFQSAFVASFEAAWDLGEFEDLIGAWSSLVELTPGVPGSAEFEEAVEGLEIFLRSYEPALRQIAARDSLPDAEPVRQAPRCFERGGTFSMNFETRWGTLETDNLFETGSGDFEIDSPLIAFEIDTFGAAVGATGEEAGDRVVLNMIAPVTEGEFIFVSLVTTPYQIVTEGPVSFKEVSSLGRMFYIDGEEFNFLGFITDGLLSIDESGFERGDVWSGHFEGTILLPPGLLP